MNAKPRTTRVVDTIHRKSLAEAFAYPRPGVSRIRRQDSNLASRIVWFDAFTTNVDHTARNTNMLVWHDRLWLIDHGASLYFHHGWDDHAARSRNGFPAIRDHVLLPFADELDAADAELAPTITTAMLDEVVRMVPDGWLGDVDQFDDIDAHRDAYVEYLMRRLEETREFLEDARHARRQV